MDGFIIYWTLELLLSARGTSQIVLKSFLIGNYGTLCFVCSIDHFDTLSSFRHFSGANNITYTLEYLHKNMCMYVRVSVERRTLIYL